MGHKAILLGIISVLLLVLILIVVGVSVTRRRPNEIKSLMGRPAPIAQALLCGQAVGAWELDDTVAVFKVCDPSGNHINNIRISQQETALVVQNFVASNNNLHFRQHLCFLLNTQTFPQFSM